MGIYLNPGSNKFHMSYRAQIYVDKSELISKLNSLIETEDRYVCVSRPRRFGKTMAANMLAAYYGCDEDTGFIFDKLKISADVSYREHLNKHMVLQLNMQNFLSENNSVEEMLKDLQKEVIAELGEFFPGVTDSITSLPRAFEKIYAKTKQTFIILIDEWDCLFREYKNDTNAQKMYLDFLRNWLKDRGYVGLAYMTGILPVKKYGSHSALNMFQEFSMTNPREMEEYVGFTEEEVQKLCEVYHRNFSEMKSWYDGYSFLRVKSVYNPKAVVEATLSGVFDSYWTKTETYEALKFYIEMNYDGLKDMVVEMLAGGHIHINTGKFGNDMSSFESADDVLTLLIHLGYLAYDFTNEEVYIPNREISKEFCNAIEGAGWNEVVKAVKSSKGLLQAIWNGNENVVAEGIEKVHYETSVLQYHDENALSYTISLALYAARQYYNVVREFPTGKGFADLVYIPRKMHSEKPAMLIELKWDKNADTAINQIKDRKYMDSLKDYEGDLLLVGINYDKSSKRHECIIEKWKI